MSQVTYTFIQSVCRILFGDWNHWNRNSFWDSLCLFNGDFLQRTLMAFGTEKDRVESLESSFQVRGGS
jgi:hypothetical protein